MKIIVPLAGPDFDRADGSVKAELAIDGQALLRKALESRIWWRRGDACDAEIVFILRQTSQSLRFCRDVLSSWYPQASTVLLSSCTAGAAFSALAGLSLVADSDEPICVDLADILYASECDPCGDFIRRPDLGGVALAFSSDKPVYSYLAVGQDGQVSLAAEKKVISRHASAGTYWFRNPSVLLRAIVHSLDNRAEQTHAGRFFVCPLFNGVIANGFAVSISRVNDVIDIKESLEG